MKYGRPMLRDVTGYTPGKQPESADVIKLNTNENPYGPSPKVGEALRAVEMEAMRRYPDALSAELRLCCAERYGYENTDWVFAGNGSDEILALAIRTFVDPGQTMVTTYPSYSLYDVLAELHGAPLESVDLDEDFQFSEAFYGVTGKLCLVTRPNAPTGTVSPREDMKRLCESFDGIVLIDEAYADFAEDTCIDFPKLYDNVMVVRTFSKSFSLAGMRIGIGVAHPDIIAELFKTKDSYNLNGLSQVAGLAAMKDHAYMEKNVARIVATRQRLRDA